MKTPPYNIIIYYSITYLMVSRKRSLRKRGSKKRQHKSCHWEQKGCQSGGGSGWPWGISDAQVSTGGSGGTPIAINGNHYPLNTANPMAPPQNSNHQAEQGFIGGNRKRLSRGRGRGGSGSGSRGGRRGRGRTSRRRRGRKYIGEQHGGMAQYMPETINTAIRSGTGIPSMFVNSLQGASTGYRNPDPIVQPIGQPLSYS
jgi:hypothetical protein